MATKVTLQHVGELHLTKKLTPTEMRLLLEAVDIINNITTDEFSVTDVEPNRRIALECATSTALYLNDEDVTNILRARGYRIVRAEYLMEDSVDYNKGVGTWIYNIYY